MDITSAISSSVTGLSTNLQTTLQGNLPAVFLIMAAFLAIGIVWRLVRKAARVR